MGDEKQSSVFQREPLRIFFVFHSFARSLFYVCCLDAKLRRANRNGHRTLYCQPGQNGNTLLLGSPCRSGMLAANGSPSSAILCGCRRRAERNARGVAASRVATALKPANAEFGGRAWHRTLSPRGKGRAAY